jgi:sugar lactone lactonase YvrE/phosphopantothenate synthetase
MNPNLPATSPDSLSEHPAGKVLPKRMSRATGGHARVRPGLLAVLAICLAGALPSASAQTVSLLQATPGEIFLAYPGGYSVNQNIAFMNTGATDTVYVSAINLTQPAGAANAFSINNNYCYYTGLTFGMGCNVQIQFNAGTLGNGNYAGSVTATYTDNGTSFTKTLALNATIMPYPTPAGVPQLAFVPGVTTLAGGGGNYSANAVPATTAALNVPQDVAVDKYGNVFIADTGYSSVRVVYAAGTLPNITNPVVGDIYTFAGMLGNPGDTGDGGAANAAQLQNPAGVAFDNAGNLYIADTGNARIREVNMTTGKISTVVANLSFVQYGFSGDGGPATAAKLNKPYGIAFDSNNNLFICDNNENVVRVVYAAGTLANISSPVVGNIYSYAGVGGGATALGSPGFSGDGGPANAASIWFPYYIAFDASNNLYISDYDNGRVRKVNASTGKISTVAGAGTYGGGASTSEGFPPLVASMDPTGVAIDASGNLFIADFSGELYEVNTAGVIDWYPSTAKTFNIPANIRPDTSGNVFVADQYDNLIAKVSPAGSLVFGSINVGATSSAMLLTLQNNGSGALTFATTPYTVAGNFAVGNSGTCNFSTTLAVGATCTVAVTFSPLSAGTLTGTITFAYGSSTLVAKLTGTGVGVAAPTITFNPTSVAFGNQTVLTTSGTTVVMITNTGSTTLNLNGIALAGTSPNDFGLNTYGCGSTLTAGSNCSVSVTFTPASATSYSATISVTDNASGSPQTVPLSGTGTAVAAPVAALSPTSIAFSNQTVNTTSATQNLTLSNTGNATLNISSIAITGANTADFAVASAAGGTTCGTTLAASGTCNIAVTFTPASATTFTAAVTVTDNSAVTTQVATLSGTGTAAAAPVAALSPTSIAFSNQTVNTTSATQNLTLSNTGNATLNISSIAITGANTADFAVASSGTTCGTTLAASGTCNIAVTFTPASATTFTAAVTVTDNSATTTQVATLSGTGTAVAAPVAALSPTSIAFSNQTVNTTSATQNLTLSNTGNATLNISSIAITGANTADFAVASAAGGTTCGSTLAASGTCNIAVTFTPASATTFTAAVTVTDNSATTTQVATLSGTGTAVAAPVAALSPTSIAFSNQTVNTTSATQNLTLSNTGNATLNISSIAITGANTADFAVASAAGGTTCGNTLAAAGTCNIAVTFTPASATSFTAAVTVTDNSAVTTQVATLSGTGISVGTSSFGVAGTPSTQTVNPGGLATFTINVTSVSGSFSNPVTLSVTGLPTGAVATFSPVSVTPGTAGASSTLTIQTSAQYALLSPRSRSIAPLLALLLLPCGWLLRRKRMRRSPVWLAVLLLTGASLGLSSCSGGYFGPPPQSFPLTVTGTASAVQQSTTVTLNVQ